MQKIAFLDAEKESYPFLDQWVKIAAIKAMALEGRRSSAFRFVRGDRSAPDGGLSVERPHCEI